MLSTTFALGHKAGACTGDYKKMAKALGGITTYGRDTPIGLDKVIEVAGLDAALWGLQCTIEPADKIVGIFKCDCAEHVLANFERVFPDDKRPRNTIEVARRYYTGKATAEELSAAESAAWAAESAARAAESAEIEWQTQHFLELLREY